MSQNINNDLNSGDKHCNTASLALTISGVADLNPILDRLNLEADTIRHIGSLKPDGRGKWKKSVWIKSFGTCCTPNLPDLFISARELVINESDNLAQLADTFDVQLYLIVRGDYAGSGFDLTSDIALIVAELGIPLKVSARLAG